ncbi:MAG TPA: hypothetical protein VE398_11410 [Acidobacteriota bacterium]|nr:hypothetical protein [Acidobacteriota bacterium]
MRERIDGPVNPLLVGGATFALIGSLFALHRLASLDWPGLCRYLMPFLVVIG